MTKRALICCIGLLLLSAAALFAEPAPQAAAPAPPAEELPLVSASCQPAATFLPFLDTQPEPVSTCIACDADKCDASCRSRNCGSGICQTLCNQHCLCFDCTNAT